MKLKKFIKHINFYTDVELTNEYNEVVYDGSVIELQVAASSKSEQKQYLKELKDDEDYVAIEDLKIASQYINYYLDTTDEYEAVSFNEIANERGIKIPKMYINIKRNKGD